MVHLSLFPAVVVLLASMVAAFTDVWKFKVYNVLTIPLLVSGLFYNAVVGGWVGLLNSGLGLLFGFTILLLFYMVGGMGAGDVKLMAAIGAWLGMPLTLCVFIASAIAGGIYAVVLMLLMSGVEGMMTEMYIMIHRMKTFSRHLIPDTRIETEVRRDDRRKRLIPYAMMVSVGVVATFLWLKYDAPTR